LARECPLAWFPAARLGQGGGGEVWEAVLEGPLGFRKRVAVKLGAASEADALLREARFGAMLRHPNVVDVYELGQAPDGRWYLAMELVSGPSLGALLRRCGPLPGPALRSIAIQLTTGLGYVHRARTEDGRGLVHCDVKPANVLLDPIGTAKLADLGIARLAGLEVDRVEGTPGYLAPEQLRGAPPDPRVDVFSCGVLLWAMAAGRSPLRPGPQPVDVLRAALGARDAARGARVILEGALLGLADVVERCLDPDPGGRYPDGAALAAALRALPEPAGEGLVELLARGDHTPTTPTDGPTALRPEDSPLFGREPERDAILAQLTPGAVVSIKGLPGVGKTRLAQHVAHLWRRDGRQVAWADPPASPDAVIPSVAGALGIRLGPLEARRQIAVALRHRGPVLVVLDGFDRHAALVPGLLAAWRDEAPEARFLLPVREASRDVGGVLVELGPLPAAVAASLFESRLGRPAPRSELDPLLRELGHLPLAIELAAARARQAPPADWRAAAAGIHSSDPIRAAVAASWESLPAWGKQALVQLSVFCGTFSMEGGASVTELAEFADAPWPFDAVDALWRRSLLRIRRSREGTRLAVPEVVRGFVLDRADPALVADAERRHGLWYARYGDPSFLDGLHTRHGEGRGRELARELEDLVAATTRALGIGDLVTAEATAQAAAAVLKRRGPHARGRQLLQEVLAAQGDAPSDQLLLGLVELGGGDVSTLDRAVACAPNPRQRARARAVRLGWLAGSGALERALAEAPDVIEAARASGDILALGRALHGHVVALRHLGRTTESEAALREAITLAVELGDLALAATAENSLGNGLHMVGRYAEARAAYQRVQGHAAATGSRGMYALAVSNEAMVLTDLGDPEAAEARAREALAVYLELGDEGGAASASRQIAFALADAGRDEEVLALARDALQFDRRSRKPLGAAYALSMMGNALRGLGRGDEARAAFAEGLALATEAGSPRARALLGGNLALLHLDAGDPDRAAVGLAEAVAFATGVAPRMEAGFLCELARAELRAGRDPGDSLSRARHLFGGTPSPYERGVLETVEALALLRLGRRDEAVALASAVSPGPSHDLRHRVAEVLRLAGHTG
jgi:tetratricopeptide (TPR) repeat protein